MARSNGRYVNPEKNILRVQSEVKLLILLTVVRERIILKMECLLYIATSALKLFASFGPWYFDVLKVN